MNLKIPQATKKGYIEVEPFGAFDWTYPDSLTRRGRVQGGVKFVRRSYAVVKYTYMKLIPLNPEPDGTCRTIKANYWKMSRANFLRRGGYGATAILVCLDCGESMEKFSERHGI